MRYVIKSCLSNKTEQIQASNKFPATSNLFNIVFGQVHAFYQVKNGSKSYSVVTYMPLEQLELCLNFPRGEWNAGSVRVADVVDILGLVGIWAAETSKKIYILRKHPGLAMLNTEECGIDTGKETDADELDKGTEELVD